MYPSSNLILALLPFTIASPITSGSRAVEGSLLIADTGLGHRSTPIGHWSTSLRRITTSGKNATTLQTFGTSSAQEPIGAYSLTYDPSSRKLFTATGQGIIRTNVDGSNPVTIFKEARSETSIAAITISGKKLYWGTGYEGLIKRADLDGKNVEIVRNVSQGLRYDGTADYTPAKSYAKGLAVDEKNGFIYWSANSISTTTGSSSVRRAPLKWTSATGDADHEVLAQGLLNPGQLRLVKDASLVYFVDSGRYYGDRTALIRVQAPTKGGDSSFAEVLAQDTMKEGGGARWIYGFAVDESTNRLWYAGYYDYRKADAAIVEMDIDGGAGTTVNGNATQIGFPVGLEYVV